MFVKRKKSGGFTLLEVVAASIIISVGLIPIMKILPSALQVSSKVEIITKCTFLAEKEMEWAKAKLLADASAYVDPSGWPDWQGQCISGASSPDDKYKYQVSDVDPYGTPSWDSNYINEIEVTVWFDKNENDSPDGDENRVTLATKVAKRG